MPAGLSLTCSLAGADVTCDWSGPTPAGFAKFLLLRGNGGSTGRVPFQSADPAASHLVDAAVPAGSYTYLIIVVDAANKPLVHSNMVPITVTGA
ncbi:MAG: hypothetical protein JWN62_4064 [Acidimicrobiales bacterium]|nr:hypothetical protein [Acidimicrobiales bacterium]